MDYIATVHEWNFFFIRMASAIPLRPFNWFIQVHTDNNITSLKYLIAILRCCLSNGPYSLAKFTHQTSQHLNHRSFRSMKENIWVGACTQVCMHMCIQSGHLAGITEKYYTLCLSKLSALLDFFSPYKGCFASSCCIIVLFANRSTSILLLMERIIWKTIPHFTGTIF